MSEIFDKLLIRIIFTGFICLSYLVFKYAHIIFYPTHRKQILKRMIPSENIVNTMTFFSRIIGLAIIFSSLEFNEYIGMAFSSIHFFLWSSIGVITYLLSLFLLDWITFQKHSFSDEVQKKKNIAFGIVSSFMAISVAFIYKELFVISQNSIIKYIALSLIILMSFSAVTRLYKFYSDHSFSKLIIQKNGGLALGYSGFVLCHALIIAAALSKSPLLLSDYILEFLLKTAIGFALVPVMLFFFRKIFIGKHFDHPANKEYNDYDLGINELMIFIFTGVFISHLLHFAHLNINFKLIALAILFFAFIYKNIHVFFFPAPRTKFFSLRFKPINSCDFIHLFSRLIGIIIIYSNIYQLNTAEEFATWASIGFVLYLVSVLITENIIFFNFNYHDEVFKNENYAYIIVNFVNTICQSFIISKILVTAESSFMNLIIFWLQSMVIYGLGTKLFKFISNLSFNSLMIQKNIGLAISFSGFILGNTIIMVAAFTQDNFDLTSFIIQVLLKTNLGILIMPLFLYGLTWVFRVRYQPDVSDSLVHLGQGLSSFSLYLAAALLTSVIIGQIHFGTIYPFF